MKRSIEPPMQQRILPKAPLLQDPPLEEPPLPKKRGRSFGRKIILSKCESCVKNRKGCHFAGGSSTCDECLAKKRKCEIRRATALQLSRHYRQDIDNPIHSNSSSSVLDQSASANAPPIQTPSDNLITVMDWQEENCSTTSQDRMHWSPIVESSTNMSSVITDDAEPYQAFEEFDCCSDEVSLNTPSTFTWWDDCQPNPFVNVILSLPLSAMLQYVPYPGLLQLSTVCRQLNESVDDYIRVLFPKITITLFTTISYSGVDETEHEHLYPINRDSHRNIRVFPRNCVLFERQSRDGNQEGIHYDENKYDPCEARLLLPDEALPHILRLRPKGQTKASLIIAPNGYIESTRSPGNYRLHHLDFSNRPMTIYYKVDPITSAHILDVVAISLPFLKRWIGKKSLEL